jgi:ABC-2 type transport system ATP-binding protein
MAPPSPIPSVLGSQTPTTQMLQDGGFTGSLTVRETVEIWRSLTARPRPTGEVFRWEPRHR